MINKEFSEKGYMDVTFHDKLTIMRVSEIMDAWKKFCSQDLEDKKEHKFTNEGGYEYKDGSNGDIKENFHYSLNYKRHCYAQSVEGNFLFYAPIFVKHMKGIISKIADSFGDKKISELIMKDPSRWTLRCLHYPSGNTEEVIAAPHVDKGITVHITEDACGLEIFWDGQWHEAQPTENSFLVYGGMLAQFYTKGEVKALCHRVVNTTETKRNGRYSIVLFIDFGDRVYDKEKYGRLQEKFPMGENYDIPHEEFEKLFTELENQIL